MIPFGKFLEFISWTIWRVAIGGATMEGDYGGQLWRGDYGGATMEGQLWRATMKV